jgi:benzodiazapine receptor
MNRNQIRQVVNILAVLATLIVNGLANALPLNGHMTGAISDQFKVLFVPAGYVFAIWGVIYIGLIAFAIYQALPSQRENDRLKRIGYWFALGCAANIAWLFAWHYELFGLTIILMLGLLISLIIIYLRLDIGHKQLSSTENWCVHIPFSIYLGWISVATIANMTDLLDYYKWNGWGIAAEIWAVLLLVAGLVLAGLMRLTREDYAYPLVLVWAFVGIAVKQVGTPVVANAAWLMSGLVILVLIIGTVFEKRKVITGISNR